MKTELQKAILSLAFVVFGFSIFAQKLPDLIPYRSGELWGYVNSKMVLKVPCKFKTPGLFYNGFARVYVPANGRSKLGFINKQGEFIIDKYYMVETFNKGMAIVAIEDPTSHSTRYGLIDTTGKEIIPAVCEMLYWTDNNNCLVAIDESGLNFVADRKGKIILTAGKNKIKAFNGKVAIVEKPGTETEPAQCGLINPHGSFRIPLSNKAFYSFDGNFIAYSEYSNKNKKDECGLMDINGKIIIDPLAWETGNWQTYDDVTRFVSRLYFVKEGCCMVQKRITDKISLYGFVDTTGKVVVPPVYQEVTDFDNGVSLAKKDGKYGLINKQNEIVMPFKYDTACGLKEGKAIYVRNGKMGFISNKGTELTPAIYDDAYPFSEGYALVYLNDKEVSADENGKVYYYPTKKGFIDENGKLVIECKYDDAYSFQKGYALVGLNRKYGYIDKAGKVVIPCKYEKEPKPDDEYDAAFEKEKAKNPYITFNYTFNQGDKIENGLLKLSCGYVDVFGHEYFDNGIYLKAKIIKSYPNICEAIEAQDYDAIKNYVDEGANLNIKYEYVNETSSGNYNKKELPMWILLTNWDIKNYDIIKLFLENGYKVNAPVYSDSSTMLHTAVRSCYMGNDRYRLTRLLIDNKADVNKRDKYNNTPLHRLAYYGCDSGDAEIAKLLIDNGADVKAKNADEVTPLKMAKKNNRSKEFIEVLKNAEKKK
jgi:hypothetical protein